MPITHYQRKTYPIASSDVKHLRDIKALENVEGLNPGRAKQWQGDEPGHYLEVRAIYTGEKREPKAGEWYLSGAIVEAYCARVNLSTAYHIARLVLVRVRMVETVELVKGGEL